MISILESVHLVSASWSQYLWARAMIFRRVLCEQEQYGANDIVPANGTKMHEHERALFDSNFTEDGQRERNGSQSRTRP